MGAVQTGVQFGGIFYEGNKSFLCATRGPISLSNRAGASSTAALGKTQPCRHHFTLIIKYNFKDTCERFDNLFDITTLK